MLPSEDIVSELTRVIWSTVLGLEAVVGATPSADAAFVTSVDITGSWEGTVSISFSRSLAGRVTAAMLAADEAETTPAEINDVISELTNIVGGNVKGLFEGPCQLSLPRVESAPARSRVGEESSSQSWFACDGQVFGITVTERLGWGGQS